MEERKLTVTTEQGASLEIVVIDIIPSLDNTKEFIIYQIPQNNNYYASILVENADSFELVTITDEKDLNFVREEIDKVAKEEE